MVYIYKILIPMCWYHWLVYYAATSTIISMAYPSSLPYFASNRCGLPCPKGIISRESSSPEPAICS